MKQPFDIKSKIFQQALVSGFIVLTILTGCKPTPSAYRGLPSTYDVAYLQIHGHCYDSVAQAVVSLDLYSKGLDLNEENHIVGTGYNLFLSDIFVPDSLLEEGEYKAITSTPLTPSSFTFLPGRDFEGYPHGAYILNIENNQVKHIQLLDSGTFTYRNDSLLFTLYYKNAYNGKAVYKCTYSGALIPWQKQ